MNTMWRKVEPGIWESPNGSHWRIELPVQLVERLDRFCRRQGKTRSQVLNAALREYLLLVLSTRGARPRPAIAQAA